MRTAVTTIERFILDQERDFPDATGELSSLLYDIALATKLIAASIRRAGLVDVLGSAQNRNVQGEDQRTERKRRDRGGLGNRVAILDLQLGSPTREGTADGAYIAERQDARPEARAVRARIAEKDRPIDGAHPEVNLQKAGQLLIGD